MGVLDALYLSAQQSKVLYNVLTSVMDILDAHFQPAQLSKVLYNIEYQMS